MKLHLSPRNGLSALEAVVVLIAIFVLWALLMPSLAINKARPERVQCANNLKQVGLGFRLYTEDHQKQFPWKLGAGFGGTLDFAGSSEVFRHFIIISNEISHPKLLRCAADSRHKPATDFGKVSNLNLSYFVSFDADPLDPQSLLAGDRNIIGGYPSNGVLRTFAKNQAAGWTKELHNMAGNVGLSDGSVQQMNSKKLTEQIAAQSLPAIRLAVP